MWESGETAGNIKTPPVEKNLQKYGAEFMDNDEAEKADWGGRKLADMHRRKALKNQGSEFREVIKIKRGIWKTKIFNIIILG